jgi:Holliday junction resolvase
MPNKNYVKGRRKEYQIVNDLRTLGYLAFRSAGSHSPVDVVAIHPEKQLIKLIQSKTDSMSENQKEKIKKENQNLNGEFWVRFEVI